MRITLEPGAEPVPGYTLIRHLGQGGFGEVWEANAPGQVRVALKFVRLDTAQAGPELRALEVIRNIRHPHLLDVQFAVQVDDRLIIAMPLCDRSLMDRLRECQAQNLPGVPRDELLGYMSDLARAVDYLNEPRHPSGDGGLIGVQHRDIKPQNVFLVGGSVRLADFGVAKAVGESMASHTGSLSPHYVAPEAIEGRVSRWSDQYALAVTYYHLRTGRLPFQGDSIVQILYAHMHERPDLSALPSGERPVVARAMTKTPEDRWPSCRAFVLGLEAAELAEDGQLASDMTVIDDWRDMAAGHSAAPPTDAATELARTQRLIAGPEPSGAVEADGPRSVGRRFVLTGLAVAGVSASLAAVLLFPKSAPTSKAGPGTSMPVEKSVAPAEQETPRAVARQRSKQPPPPLSIRSFIAEAGVQAAIRDHLRRLDRADRPFARYFTLTNLHNNPKVNDEELRLARAGVSKLINSLSRKPAIVVPALLGPHGTVMAVDLRRLGWDNSRVWLRILAEYPYGLKFTNHDDPAVREVAEEIETLVGDEADLPDVRADWFIDTASRPPLYHAILDIPTTAQALEKSLHVDVESDFLNNTLRRAGFTKSGVSKQMRLVDRHDSDLGYYWKSYDFRKSDQSVNLFRFPLGPSFAANPFPNEAFTHAGGEIIFSLPNRLQGYMLIDSTGRRIDEGPPDIDCDANESAGTSTIVNGLSCMGCHKNGIIEFLDRIRSGVAVAGESRRKVERLFPEQHEMDRCLRSDQAQYLNALAQAVGPFLSSSTSREEEISARELKEPIVPIARIFRADIDAAAVAAELNVEDTAALRTLIRANPRLQELGLADVLKDGGAIKRTEWGTAGRGSSTYQQASSAIHRGLRFVPRPPKD